MARALIGHTGFVGSNLLQQAEFDDVFRSVDIEAIAGRDYDLVVCAGAPGTKWLANQDPAQDRASVERLAAALQRVTARHFVLISTVDVFGAPIGVDETAEVDDSATAYGRHRRWLEQVLGARFTACTVLRLPGLFGPGLKKNLIFDLLHGDLGGREWPNAVFQLYDLGWLWRDIERARAAGIPLLHLATEPTAVREIAEQGFGVTLPRIAAAPGARYDLRTRYDVELGGAAGYLYGKSQVLDALRQFLAAQGWPR
ncbi:MAG: NAD(P)-dependent oxidoreductase [Planctomycetes bacterium]|nr:NAD(P)-dependent oxidoreductase [Planctomycetota bacterium]MCB9869898.1 NAD(P)-dependent oxidoreductase [Planctomycetota bacterium]MCB9889128.1 NAD(P)-dependent oxidoreductase [Planctomycetota bacterium]